MVSPPGDLDGDLAVDVLVIGAGIQGLYIAREVAKTYSVCVVSDPATSSGTLESDGYLSAGYDGNDVNRIQPARRAAAWWRLWAESNGVAFDPEPAWFVVPRDELSSRTRLWTDAALGVTQVDELPPLFADGSLGQDVPFHLETDVVINPAVVLTELRRDIADRCLEGEVVRFGLFTDEAIDDVQVQVGDVLVPIVARFVVVAAGVGNADLLTKLSSRFSDQARRKSSKELVDACQAVRIQYEICVRGQLPALNGRFGPFIVASHGRGADGWPGEPRTWVISAPIDDAQTTMGPANTRFDPSVDSARVTDLLAQLFAIAPELEKRAGGLQWSVYTYAAHPAPVAGGGRHLGGGPAGARQVGEARPRGLPGRVALAPGLRPVRGRLGGRAHRRGPGRAGHLCRQPPAQRPGQLGPRARGTLGPSGLRLAGLGHLLPDPRPARA